MWLKPCRIPFRQKDHCADEFVALVLVEFAADADEEMETDEEFVGAGELATTGGGGSNGGDALVCWTCSADFF